MKDLLLESYLSDARIGTSSGMINVFHLDSALLNIYLSPPPPPPCGQFYYYLMVSSHHNPDVINVAAEEKIIYSPLHAIALSQPLDKGPFSPLKTCWKRAGRTVTRYDFSTLFSEAWKCAMSQANVVAGFRTTGVHPFSRDKIEITATKHPKSCGKVLTSQEA